MRVNTVALWDKHKLVIFSDLDLSLKRQNIPSKCFKTPEEKIRHSSGVA